MQRYTITGSVPIQMWPAGNSESLTLTNASSTDSVYLSDTPTVGGYPVGPGSSLTWDRSRPLFASCDDGKTVELLVLANSGPLFSSSAIASSIMSAGLAEAIANQITLNGVPPINTMFLLADQFTSLSAGQPLEVLIDTTRYSSILVMVYDDATTAQYRECAIDWGDIRHGFVTASRAYSGPDVGGRHATYWAPVMGIAAGVNIGPAANTSTVTVLVFGLMKDADKPRYQLTTSAASSPPPTGSIVYDNQDGMIGLKWASAPPLGWHAWYPSVHNGRYRFIADTGAGGGMLFTVIDALSDMPISQIAAIAASSSYVVELVVPARPIKVLFNFSGTAPSYVRFTATAESL